MIYPDYKNNIVNIAGSIEKYFDLKSEVSSLGEIDEVLNTYKPKNVVVILFDGMGYNLINEKLPNTFLVNNIVKKVISTCPSTTTSATTSIMTGKYPCTHGYLGWDMYYKNENAFVTMFTNIYKDGDKEYPFNIAEKYFSYKTITDRILENGKYHSKIVFPIKYEETYKEIFPYYSENFKNEYSKFEENYLKILEFERRLEPYAKQKWTEFLTNPINHDSSHYAYLAHTFTGGEVDPSKMHKVCTSLLTENIQTIGEFGLLFGADNNFDECCCEDAGSWEISKDEYIDRDLLKNWQYPSTEDNTLFYEFENVSKILLPQDIESSVLEGGIVTYSEIVLTGNVHPIGVFYTDKCKDIEKAKQYAEKYNLELIHITPNLDKVYIK